MLSGATEIAPLVSLPCGGRTRTTTFTLSVFSTTLSCSASALLACQGVGRAPSKSWLSWTVQGVLVQMKGTAMRLDTPVEWSAAPPRLLLRGIVVPRDGPLCKGDLRSTVLYLGGRLLCGGAGMPGLPSCSIFPNTTIKLWGQLAPLVMFVKNRTYDSTKLPNPSVASVVGVGSLNKRCTQATDPEVASISIVRCTVQNFLRKCYLKKSLGAPLLVSSCYSTTTS